MWLVFIAFSTSTRYGPPVRPVTVEEQLALSEDDEEEDEEGEGEDDESDGGWSPEDRDFVPEDLTDLKMRIKVTGSRKRRKGGKPTRDLRAEAAEEESEEEDERVFSNNYSEVCKFSCNVCGEEVDSDQLKKHMANLHSDVADQVEEGLDGGGKRFHKKTWHRCGICGKQVGNTVEKYS